MPLIDHQTPPRGRGAHLLTRTCKSACGMCRGPSASRTPPQTPRPPRPRPRTLPPWLLVPVVVMLVVAGARRRRLIRVLLVLGACPCPGHARWVGTYHTRKRGAARRTRTHACLHSFLTSSLLLPAVDCRSARALKRRAPPWVKGKGKAILQGGDAAEREKAPGDDDDHAAGCRPDAAAAARLSGGAAAAAAAAAGAAGCRNAAQPHGPSSSRSASRVAP